MISEKMISMISEQIRREYESAYLYLEIADYYNSTGLDGFSNWFKIQAREEEDHAMILYEYLHANNARVSFYDIHPRNKDYNDFKVPLNEALIHETYITESIVKLYENATKEKDYGTQIFLQWFISEQQEEEAQIQTILTQLTLYGSNPCGLHQLNNIFKERKYSCCNKLKDMEGAK